MPQSRAGRRLSLGPILVVTLLSALTCDPDAVDSQLPLDPAESPRSSVSAAPASERAGDQVGRVSDRFTVRRLATAQPRGPSPHWNHMRTSTIDYRIHYQGARSHAEWDWAASKYDVVVGGRLDEYRRRNPTIRMFVYDLFYGDEIADVQAFESWLTANGYDVESAYIHKAGGSKVRTDRITYRQWNKDYYAFNLADPGFRAWREVRTKKMVAENSAGQAFDALFIDVFSSGGIEKAVPAVTLEYASRDAYYSDLRQLLGEQRTYTRAGLLNLNVGNYYNKQQDQLNAAVAGGVMTEFANAPYNEQRWSAVDQLVADGITVQFATGVASNRKNQRRHDMNGGNYATISDRVLMWEYASYLMVVDPAKMDAVLFETYGLSWAVPMSATWLRAFEHDIGLATEKRRVLESGTDGAGQPYDVWARTFEGGLVLIRPRKGSNTNQYGDQTAVDVALPDGAWRMLLPDGTVTDPLATIRLRNGESAVFVK